MQTFHDIGEPWGRTVGEVTKWRCQPAITRISRQIRQETLPVYYGTNEFTGYGCLLGDIELWLRHFGQKNASMVRHLSFFARMDREGKPYHRAVSVAAAVMGYGLQPSSVRSYDRDGKLERDGATDPENKDAEVS